MDENEGNAKSTSVNDMYLNLDKKNCKLKNAEC